MADLDIKIFFTLLIDLIKLGDYRLACVSLALSLAFLYWRKKLKREWFLIGMILIAAVISQMITLKKIDEVQTELVVLQTQIGSTICMSLEKADNETDMTENN